MFLHTCDPMGGPQPLFGVRRASPNTTGRPTATEARCVVPSLICGPVHLQLSASNGNVLVQEARWWSLDTLAETEYQMWIRSVQLIRMSKGFQTWEPRIVWHIHEVIILYHISVWHAQEYNGPSWNNIVYNNTHTHTYIYITYIFKTMCFAIGPVLQAAFTVIEAVLFGSIGSSVELLDGGLAVRRSTGAAWFEANFNRLSGGFWCPKNMTCHLQIQFNANDTG